MFTEIPTIWFYAQNNVIITFPIASETPVDIIVMRTSFEVTTANFEEAFIRFSKENQSSKVKADAVNPCPTDQHCNSLLRSKREPF